MFIIYKGNCYVCVKVGSGPSSAFLGRGGDGPVCLCQPMVVVNRWSRLSALGLVTPAAGTGRRPSADCSLSARTIPKENRRRHKPAGIPSSPVRGRRGQPKGTVVIGQHACHAALFRVGQTALSDPNRDAKAVLSALFSTPATNRIPTSIGSRVSATGMQGGGIWLVACQCPLPDYRLLQGARLWTVGQESVQETFSGG